MALLAGLAEFVGGILVAVEFLMPLAAVALIAVMVVAALTVHLKNGFFAQNGSYEFNLALAEDANIDSERSGFSSFALAHNVAEKEEVDSVLEEAVSAGATITREAQDTFFGRNGYFADSEGYLWEVAWNPTFPIAEDGTISLPD